MSIVNEIRARLAHPSWFIHGALRHDPTYHFWTFTVQYPSGDTEVIALRSTDEALEVFRAMDNERTGT